MKSLVLGSDHLTGVPVQIPHRAFATHFHLLGGTGKGKTTAIHTMLHPLFIDPHERTCFFVIDRMGNLSSEVLLWMASPFCPAHVRDRLVYIEAAREDVVLGFNPLLYKTEGEGYFKVLRATEIILRAWESVDLSQMPRLARWTFNAFWAVAQLGLTIADSVHLLMPNSPYHGPLLRCLPAALQAEWGEVIGARGSRALELLDSSRNRLKPYYESSILRRMFGSSRNHFDVLRFMREGRIVLLNLAPRGRIPTQVADAIGAMVLNEVIATARSLPDDIRYPTYLLLDEFQNFVGPDIESALPEVRQLGLKLILSHQSLSQLKRGDHDLTSMIFQAQSRMVFGLQGEDADLIANELASIEFDPKRIKEENYGRRQRIAGHRLVELASWSDSQTEATSWNQNYGTNWSAHESVSHGLLRDTLADGKGSGGTEARGQGASNGRSSTHGAHEQLVPIHEDFTELTNRSYYTFEEQRSLWASKIRKLKTGRCILRLVDDDALHDVDVKQSKAGYLAWDLQRIHRHLPQVIDSLHQLKEKNFQSDIFVSPESIDREVQHRLDSVVRPPITLQSSNVGIEPVRSPVAEAGDVFG